METLKSKKGGFRNPANNLGGQRSVTVLRSNFVLEGKTEFRGGLFLSNGTVGIRAELQQGDEDTGGIGFRSVIVENFGE